MARVPFNVLVGMRLHHVHRDGITIVCTLRRALQNSAGAAHGGLTASMADAAVGIAIYRHFGGKRSTTTVELKNKLFSSRHPGPHLRAFPSSSHRLDPLHGKC